MTFGKMPCLVCVALVASLASGCRSPYYADRGALAGGLGGAGIGALVGNAVGHTGAGAAIGAGVGTLGGALVGNALDDIESRNRAMISQQIGRPVPAGAVSVNDVITMSQAGVDPELIVAHVDSHGLAQPLNTQDIIELKQQNVNTRVIRAMQSPRPPAVMQQPPIIVHEAPPPPVIVEEHYYGDPFFGPGPCYAPPHRHCAPPPRVAWGFSYSD